MSRTHTNLFMCLYRFVFYYLFQGRRLSINISPSPVLSQLDDTGCSNIDVSEEECSLAKKPDEDGDL